MPEQIMIPKIDPKVFKYKRTQIVQNKAVDVLKETTMLPIIVDCKAPPDIPQGIELWYQDIPFPRKGFPDADIINALNHVKKDTISWIKTLGQKQLFPLYLLFALIPKNIRIINKSIDVWLVKQNYWLNFWYYEPQYYCPFAFEIWKFIKIFLEQLGINSADNLGEIACMFMEHDDAWRVRPQDLFTAMNKQALLKNPRKEIKRITKLYLQREHLNFNDGGEKIDSALRLLSYALLIPKVKKAFIFAIKSVDWDKLRFDKGDEYWALQWGNYDALGEIMEQRRQKWSEIHQGKAVPYKKINFGNP